MIAASLVASENITVGVHPLWKLFGFSVNADDVIACLVAGGIVLGLGLLLRVRATSGVPGRLQLSFETVVGAVSDQIDSTMGERGQWIVPLAMTIFMLILFANWLELIPTGAWGGAPSHLPAPTGDINLPAAMAVVVIVLVHASWIRYHGLRAYLHHYRVPSWFLLPINVIEELAKPISLTLRLFGNIFSGGLILVLIASLLPAKLIVPIPLLDVVWRLFDGLFVGPIQAFIFTMLSLLYFESTVTGGH